MKKVEFNKVEFNLEIKHPDTNEDYIQRVMFNEIKYIPRVGEDVCVNGTHGAITKIVHHYNKAFAPYIEIRVKVTEPFEYLKQLIISGRYCKI